MATTAVYSSSSFPMRTSLTLTLTLTLISLILIGYGAEGGAYCSTRVLGRQYAKCAALDTQDAALAYTYERARRVVHVAFTGRATSPGGWVAWGVNPDSWGMAGASVLVAFQAQNGTNLLPFKLTMAAQGGDRLHCSAIDLTVLDKAVHFNGGSDLTVTILASILLRPGQSTALNMLWNRGSAVQGFSPLPHSLLPEDLRGFSTIDVAA